MVNEATQEDKSTESNHQDNQEISPSIVALGPMSRRIHRRNVLPPLEKDNSMEKLKNTKRSVHYSASELPRRNLAKPMLVHHKSTKSRKSASKSKTQKMSRYGHLEAMRNPKPKHLPPTAPVYKTRAKTAIPKAQIAEAAKILSLEDMEEKSY